MPSVPADIVHMGALVRVVEGSLGKLGDHLAAQLAGLRKLIQDTGLKWE
jgi:hypothetical protein